MFPRVVPCKRTDQREVTSYVASGSATLLILKWGAVILYQIDLFYFVFIFFIMQHLPNILAEKWMFVNIDVICHEIKMLGAALGPSIQLPVAITALNTHFRALYTIQIPFLSNFTSKTYIVCPNMMETEPLTADSCSACWQTQADLISTQELTKYGIGAASAVLV